MVVRYPDNMEREDAIRAQFCETTTRTKSQAVSVPVRVAVTEVVPAPGVFRAAVKVTTSSRHGWLQA